MDLLSNRAGTTNRLVRVLVSERGYSEIFSAILHEIARPGISVVVITPPNIHEHSFLATAAKQRWDLAILMLNNFLYGKGSRTSEDIIANAGQLVGTMHRLFNKPMICLSGLDNAVAMGRAVMDAGGECLFQVPINGEAWEELKQMLKRYLPIW